MNAQRLLHGQRVYLDFFQSTPPGTDLVYLGVFKVFGARIWVTNLIVLALGGNRPVITGVIVTACYDWQAE
jgi:hypothetical protein